VLALTADNAELSVMYWWLRWRLGVQVARWQSDVLCSRAAQMVSVVKIQEIAISSYIPHPANVVAVALSPLRTDAGATTVTAYVVNMSSLISVNF